MAGRPRKKSDAHAGGAELRVKVRLSGGVIGPGKIALLEHVAREGSISAAARCMDMSFRRAWHLIGSLDEALGRPVLETEVGGSGGGGARLTAFGRELVARYREAMAVIDTDAKALLQWLESEQADDRR